MDAVAAAALGVALILILLTIRWKLRSTLPKTPAEPVELVCQPAQFVHRLCPHNNVVQGYDVEKKDSLDEHLDVLARKLAEKESRLRLSKSKIRQTQNEIQSLHVIDHNVRLRYREIMDALRSDLLSNEKECRKLQEQIEWVSRRRAELKEEASEAAIRLRPEMKKDISGLSLLSGICDQERTRWRRPTNPAAETLVGDRQVRRGHKMYGEAATELASNLAELQRGRIIEKITEKPASPTITSPRLRKEPLLPNAVPMSSLIIKSSPPPESIDHRHVSQLRHSSN